MTSPKTSIRTKHSVRARLLSAILITSSGVTLILTAIQLANDYRADLNYIEKRMDEIRVGRSKTLAGALWQLDSTLLETGLEGLLAVQDVTYVEIDDKVEGPAGKIGEAPYKAGTYDPHQAIIFTEPLYRTVEATDATPTLQAGQKIHIGNLNVVFSKKHIYARLENKAILIAFTQAIKTFVVSFLIMIFIRLFVTQHLSTMASYFDNFNINNLNLALKLNKTPRKGKPGEDTRDEIDLVADSINKMIDKVKETYKIQQEHQNNLRLLNESLDQRVKEQTAQLAEEKNQISILLNNMSQAVFRVGADGRIVGPISHFSNELFGASVEGHDVFQLIFEDANLDSIALDTIKGVFSVSFGEGPLQWDMNSHNLPDKLNLKKLGKSIRLSYTPMFNDLDELTQILFVIEDITKIQKLEEQRIKNTRQMALLQAFANATDRDRMSFFATTKEQIQSVENLMTQGFTQASLVETYRLLHTLKGNARMLRFEDIAQATHALESQISGHLAQLRSGQTISPEEHAANLAKLGELQKAAVEAANIGAKFFGLEIPMATEVLGGSDRAETIEVLKRNYEDLRQLIGSSQNLKDQKLLTEIRRAVQRLLNVSLAEGLEKLRPMVSEISTRLGKEVDLKIDGPPISVSPPQLEKLKDAAVHTIRNALDHGLESAEQRIAQNKNKMGSIAVRWTVDPASQSFTFIIEDDGRGIDTHKVLEKARELGAVKGDAQLSESEILRLIFLPSLSTADQVTDISGRGAGMDVVSSVVTELHGEIQISSLKNQGTRLTFTFPNWDDATPVLKEVA